ncbi:MAG TPA: hypothetical protein V6D47_18575 [Oscillatoriaceae cyanobacterium]
MSALDLAPLLGLPLDEARQRLSRAGVTPRVVESLAPRAGDAPGLWRVARARAHDGGVELVTVLAPTLPE